MLKSQVITGLFYIHENYRINLFNQSVAEFNFIAHGRWLSVDYHVLSVIERMIEFFINYSQYKNANTKNFIFAVPLEMN